jgi:hypothetical protein
VLFSSVLVATDAVGWLWSDMIWTGSQPNRRGRGIQVLSVGWGITLAIVLLTSAVSGQLSASYFLKRSQFITPSVFSRGYSSK